uniref:Ig-like domain-containing protein n=1 Tax=Maylandia zebra TaxID=106582 RepID=A0A3P9CY16_9CICH
SRYYALSIYFPPNLTAITLISNKVMTGRELEVFVPSEVDVTEGEDATLPCRSGIAGQSVKSARWRTNGNAVLQLDAKTGGITYGEDVDTSRVSIPSEWDRQADLSLTIKGVQQQDEGVYYCDIDKWERHRSAVRLRVHPQLPTAADSTPLKCCQLSNQPGFTSLQPQQQQQVQMTSECIQTKPDINISSNTLTSSTSSDRKVEKETSCRAE